VNREGEEILGGNDWGGGDVVVEKRVSACWSRKLGLQSEAEVGQEEREISNIQIAKQGSKKNEVTRTGKRNETMVFRRKDKL